MNDTQETNAEAEESVASQLGTEPIGPLLLRYSLPAIASTTIVSLYNICSSIFIGHGVGPLAITGLAVTFPFMNLVLAVAMLVAIGGATVCSIELGAKNYDRAKMVLGHNVVLSLIFGAVFAVASLAFLDPILLLFGASEDTLGYARDYMEVILWGAPIGALMIALSHFMRASGHPAKSMFISLFSVGSNFILTPIFIFVLHWGIRGAAVATVLSQVFALFFLLAHFCNKSHLVHFVPGIFRLRLPVMRSMLSIGLSPFLMNSCACLVIVIINISLRAHGGDLSIGAYGIANRLIMLFAMVIIGLTQGMQPLIGFNYGARKMDRVKKTLVYGLIVGTIVTTCGFLAFQLFPAALARMFTTHQDLIAMAVRGLRLCTAFFFLVGSQIVISAFFQSMGKAPVAIFLSLSRQMVFLIPGLLVLPRFFGVDGVWISLPVADVCASVITFLILRHTYRSTRYAKM
ncbi:MATE family efflux transporter [Desulfovibrio sp. OttesenSCG-928-O18]|nr:MATE family efflux transporter [Desulfovibrio sp. OttesenSCG-928-O18]